MILVDTNILLRLASATDPLFFAVGAAVNALESRGESLCIVPQNLYEFWATATRPGQANGLGFSIPECQAEIARIKHVFRLLPDEPGLVDEWERLVVAHQCHGRVSYDARLVAAMVTHGLTRLLTIHVSDFARFPGLTLIDPTAGPPPTAPPGP